MSGAWPNFFIPGAAKAGTTSLHRYLAEHPEIFMTELKEVHFFTKRWEATHGDEEAFSEALEAYRQRFAPGEDLPVRGESTPAYLHHPDVPDRIAEHVPEAKFVVSLRDPVERAHSDHSMLVRQGHEDRSFLEVARQEAAGEDDRHTKRGLYDQHLERYFDAFGRDNVHVVLFEDFKQDTLGVLQSIAGFLDVSEEAMAEVDYETVHNPGGEPRNAIARWLLDAEPLHELARTLLPKSWRIWLGDHALVEEGQTPPLEEEAARLFAEVYAPHMERLEAMLDRELSELRVTWPET